MSEYENKEFLDKSSAEMQSEIWASHLNFLKENGIIQDGKVTGIGEDFVNVSFIPIEPNKTIDISVDQAMESIKNTDSMHPFIVERLPGFYWVKFNGTKWDVAELSESGCWYSTSTEHLYDEDELYEINETRILNPDER